MKRNLVLIAGVAALVAAALIAAGLAGASKSRGATVGWQQSKYGRILVDTRGRSLYLFERDKRGKSSCNGACVSAWPPLIASGKLRAGSGVKASLLGRTKRKDGRWQVTYNRHPLYTLVNDTRKGQTNGEGVYAFGAEWYLVSPAGAKIEKGAASSSGSGYPPSGGYGGYGGGY
jgi:predicted lipoprotein with Yx(FWY)xxD motif